MKKTLLGVEKAVNEFAKANHDFVNDYKDLKQEISERNRAMFEMPHEHQEKVLKGLNAAINEKLKLLLQNTEKVLKL
ncbi:hypothetical protein [Borreliella burgdorferi]|uniref:hypothetical protein n=1 Tax=Borreliella burgdorferi TaxID=139 RepID=UPI000D041326|nr:hypothetical protein [Borreliella burgdorferi]MCD2386249.1 hypothetical protein [Borreliella burgdorferi]MCD2387499.1 hypothetical protein [Borreliella burgdorferi]MCD2390433.1 hypothetical protein [Borreliella burgdorferi]PRR32128.1 hypothetical protein CV693_05725 [Borreliella burgdorferi]PRR35453.1 hypothetical protein CV687_05895 [Borreliella burgdorferi]